MLIYIIRKQLKTLWDKKIKILNKVGTRESKKKQTNFVDLNDGVVT